ncbi:hypothetical protein Y136_15435 [Listeria monocytogenes]|nr:hypothetical protein [Listeria monocytogenes]EAE0903930.1 hypothetical protein [Listeria monocytogenes]
MNKKNSIIFVFNILLLFGILNLINPYLNKVDYNLQKVLINCGGLILLVIAFLSAIKKENKS